MALPAPILQPSSPPPRPHAVPQPLVRSPIAEESIDGWCLRPTVRADGSFVVEQIPLTYEELVHPREGDVVTHSRLHALIVRLVVDVLVSWTKRHDDDLTVVDN
ncbi:MAG: hypothetical protein GY856_46460, partial [bacterium]|nr:hypothetical protein [bacterium]